MIANFISVFICTYNPNPDFLRRTVDGLLSQDLSGELWELTIIDNNSTLSVSEIDFIKEKKVKVVVEKKQGLTAARGCAVNIAKGEILVFVDDDNILNKDYLTQVRNIFELKELGIVSGAIFPEYVKSPEKWFYMYEEMIAIRRFTGENILLNESSIYNNLFPIGAGLAIRKELIKSYYEEHLTTENYIEGRKGEDLSSGEDLDLDFYALNKLYKIGIYPKLILTHIIPEVRITTSYIAKLAKSSLKSSLLLNKKWGKVFKHNVFEGFELSNGALFLRILFNGVLAPFNKSKYIRYNLLKELLKLKRTNLYD
ncbi:MAG: glycosyltransferase family 2 protein [Flavobacterium sp.]|nr:MAG: glycosyltransferase family 2 protein [Flavobacterium sp.]